MHSLSPKRASAPLNVHPSFRKKLLACLLGGTALAGVETYAATLNFEALVPVEVDEPNTGSRTVSLTLRATFNDGDPTWQTQSTCTISGTVQVIPPDVTNRPQATSGVDFTQTNQSFSMTTQPFQGETGIPEVTAEIEFEILDDGDETESVEDVSYRLTSYGVTCSDQANRTVIVSRGYGTIVISDPFDVKGAPSAERSPIPTRQKSLSSQLNSLRTLSLHNSITRDRAIAKEVDRARKSRGFSSDGLQVKLNGEHLPAGALLGGAAGDSAGTFGRWGFFVTGNLDVGEEEKSSSFDTDFRSSMLIAGFDYKMSDNAVLGAALTRSDTDAGSDETANTDFTRAGASIFGSLYSNDSFYLDVMLTYGTSSYDLDRRIILDGGGTDTGFADTDGNEMSASVGVGYTFHHQNLKTRLFSFFNYLDATIDGYSETVTGSSSAAVVDKMDLQSLIGDVGVELSWNINTDAGVFTPTLSVAQERQFDDDPVDVTGRFVGGIDSGEFGYSTLKRDDAYLNAQVGFSAVFQNGISAYLTYDTFIDRKDLASSQWSVGGRWEF